VGDDRQFLFCQKLLGEIGSVRRGFVILKQPGVFSPKFGAISSQDLMHSPQNFAVESGIYGLAYLDKFCWIDGGISPEYFGYHLV
jgi:hypothetical protein